MTVDGPPLEEIVTSTECPACGEPGGGAELEVLIDIYGYTGEVDGVNEFDVRLVPTNGEDIPYCCPDDSDYTYVIHP